jgi:hypothetical protein
MQVEFAVPFEREGEFFERGSGRCIHYEREKVIEAHFDSTGDGGGWGGKGKGGGSEQGIMRS